MMQSTNQCLKAWVPDREAKAISLCFLLITNSWSLFFTSLDDTVKGSKLQVLLHKLIIAIKHQLNQAQLTDPKIIVLGKFLHWNIALVFFDGRESLRM